jgi:hypothetical protein
MGRYSHVFTIAFSLESDSHDAEDVTAQRLANAARLRINECLENDEMLEAVGSPDQTFEKEIEQ